MKKNLLILISLFLVIGVSGCGVVTKEGTKNVDVTLSPEEKYSKALGDLQSSDYTHTVLSENYGEYYSDITEYKYVVDKDSEIVTSRISSSKYKTSSMSEYKEGNMPGNEQTQLSYDDFSTNKSISYDFQCGKGWNYYSIPDRTYTGVDSKYGMVLMMTKDVEPISIEEGKYSFTLTEANIKEVTGEIFPTKDGNVNVVVSLEGTKVKSMTMSYTSLYGTGKFTITFDEIGNQTIDMPEEVKNAKSMQQGQACY